jgi:hypothetical protein
MKSREISQTESHDTQRSLVLFDETLHIRRRMVLCGSCTSAICHCSVEGRQTLVQIIFGV